MKLGEAIPKYQAYRKELQDKKTSIYKQYKKTKEKAERTIDEEWIQKAEQLGEEQQKQQEKERKREWKVRLPEDFEDLSLVEILAKTQFQKTYMDVIGKAVEAEIPEKIVKSYIWNAMDEEEIERQIKIQRILQVSEQS